jgi:hypothetical protein
MDENDDRFDLKTNDVVCYVVIENDNYFINIMGNEIGLIGK